MKIFKSSSLYKYKADKKGVQMHVTVLNSKSDSRYMIDQKDWWADFDKLKKSKLASIYKLQLGNVFL